MTVARMIAGVEVKPLVVFRDLTIENEDFAGCDLRGATFIDCIIKNCNFTAAELSYFDASELDDGVEPLAMPSPHEQEDLLQEWKRRLYSIDSPSPWRDAESTTNHNFDGGNEAEVHKGDIFWRAVEVPIRNAEAVRVDAGVEDSVTRDDDGPLSIKTLFIRSTVDQCDFGNINLDGLHFEVCEIVNSSFRKSTSEFAWFINSSLVGIDAQDAELMHSLFLECEVSKVNFAGSNLEEASFTYCEIDTCDFREASIDGIELDDVRLSDCDFSNADMRQIFGRDVQTSGSTNLDLSKLLELEEEDASE